MTPISIYIHIPFCDHKCIYCDFYSIINDENSAEYLNALQSEIKHYSSFVKNKVVKSIFFGGGTPSYMSPKYIGSIINCISKYYEIADDVEITLETNPGTVLKEKLKNFLTIGINRISIGIQSFDDEELKFLTRIHSSIEAVNTVEYAFSVGFNNISIDLIFNLPKQTKKKWLQNMKTAVGLPIKHISAYSLILEKGTILNKMVLEGKVNLQDEDYDAELYEMTIDYLTDSGFNQYEVSNFAKQGYQCRHNNVYWEHKEYLGFGTSAHSFVGKKRWWNYSSLKMYIEAMNKIGNAVRNSESLTSNEMLEEYVMLNLRGNGLNRETLLSKYGSKIFNKNISYIRNLITEGYLTDNNNVIRMTKKGYLVCDEIISNLLINI